MYSGTEFGIRGSGVGGFVLIVALAFSACAYAGGLSDPTRPNFGAGAAAATSGWQLSSTLISPHRRLAIINGRAVAVGDRIAGATVVAIQPATVQLRTDAGEVTLELVSTDIKRPSNNGHRTSS